MTKPRTQDRQAPSLGKRLWRRYRWPALSLAALVAGWFLLTQSPLTGAIVLSRLSRRLGAEVQAERVRVWLDGTVTLDRVSARAPGVPGPAAVFAEAERVRALVDWGGLVSGRQSIRVLSLTRPILRVSQSMTEGSLNLPRAGMPGVTGGPTLLPRVRVTSGVLELGEHTPTGYRWLKRIAIDGEITPAPTPEGGGYAVRLQERRASDEPGAAQPFALEGRINDAGLTLILQGVDMKDWPASAVPTPIRPRWEQLALEGRLSDIRFTHAFAAGSPVVRATLDGVALNLPLPAEGAPQTGEAVTVASGAFLRVHGTSGTLTLTPERIDAELTGLIEDLPYHIRLAWMGVEPDAAFECVLTSEGFELGKDPRVLRYAPQTIRERLSQFSNPTGNVDTRVVFRRGPPVDGEPAEVRLEGELVFRDAVSSFADFPYEFRDLSGRVRFTADSITFEDIRGRAPTGATIHARAYVAPLTDDAGVDVHVEVRDVPLLDPALKAGLGDRAFLVDQIISLDAFERLIARGVLRRPQDPGPAPVFEPGGTLDLSIDVRRIFGERSRWAESILATVRQPRLLPARFPLPLVAPEASLIIRDDQVDIPANVFTTPTGGVVELAGRLNLGVIAPGKPLAPDLSLVADAVPADSLLRQAVAEALDRRGEPGAGINPAALVRSLDSSGVFSGRVDIAIDPAGEPSARGRVRLHDVRLRPATGDGFSSIELAGLSGAVDFGPSSIAADVAGCLQPADAPGPPLAEARVTAAIDASGASSAVSAGVRLDDLDVSAPLEDFARLLSPSIAADARDLRRRHNPAGTVDASIVLRVDEPGAARGEVTLSDLRGLEFDAAGTRAGLDSTGGSATIVAGDARAAVARFDDLAASLRVDGEHAGSLRVSGTAPLGEAPGPHRVSLRLEGARFESALARRAAERVGNAAAAILHRYRPAGTLDVDANVVWARAEPRGRPEITARLTPRTLSLAAGESRVEFDQVRGYIEIDEHGGRLADVRLEAPRWRLDASGDWHTLDIADAGERLAATFHLALEGTRPWEGSMPADLRAVLPAELAELLDDLGVDVSTSLSASDVRVSLSDGPGGLGMVASGRVRAEGLSLEAGLPVTDASGSMEFLFERPAGARPAFECWATLDRFNAASVELANGRLRAVGLEDGSILVPTLEAECHGGRIAAVAALRRGADDRLAYEVDARVADVRFDRLLADLRAGSEPDDPSERGRLDAHVGLSGIVGDERSRRGRGFAQVGGGRVVSMPLALSLIRVSNLQPPTDERLRLARANFQIDGRRVVFEELSLSSASVEIVGYGTMDWPTRTLDLRFNSRSGRRIPILSDLLETVRDELITTEVTGTPADPQVRLSSLPATRWVFRRLLGVEPSPQEQRLERIRAEAAQHEDRLRRRRVVESRAPDAPAPP